LTNFKAGIGMDRTLEQVEENIVRANDLLQPGGEVNGMLDRHNRVQGAMLEEKRRGQATLDGIVLVRGLVGCFSHFRYKTQADLAYQASLHWRWR
jgi:hypothetical protein